MALVESPLFTILLQTMLEEVRHRFLPLYNHLKALTRGIRKATAWYNSHLKLDRPSIRGQESQLSFSWPKMSPTGRKQDQAAAGQQALYPDVRYQNWIACLIGLKYLSTAILLACVETGELYHGHFNAKQYNQLEGSVQCLSSLYCSLAERTWIALSTAMW